MKNLFTSIICFTLFLLSTPNLQAQSISYSSQNCNKALCMTIEDLGCNIDGLHCFYLEVTSMHKQNFLSIYFDGELLQTCENTNICSMEYCIDTEKYTISLPKYFGCSNDLMQDGCVVTIDPC